MLICMGALSEAWGQLLLFRTSWAAAMALGLPPLDGKLFLLPEQHQGAVWHVQLRCPVVSLTIPP